MPPERDMQPPQEYVRSLAKDGSAVTVDKCIPLKRYFRSGPQMLRMAKMYLDEGELEYAFVLYNKYMTLFIEQIPKHPEYHAVSDVDKAETRQNLKSILSIGEKLKKNILLSYTEKYEKWKTEKEAEEKLRQMRLLEEQEQRMKELKLQEEFEKEKDWRLNQGREMLKATEITFPENQQVDSFGYDDDSRSQDGSYASNFSPTPSLYSVQSIPSALDNENRANSQPTIDRSTKPRSMMSPGPDSAYVHGLRIIIVPYGGINTFLGLAKPNTEKNTETCGILAGKMSHNQLMVTHLLIPKQTGTPDSCSTDNEEDIFMYQDKHNLITLGWIHTHPSQTAFMSSVDLHTHCSYQLMMPEAIAIVCSPKYDKTCIFSLTSNYGLDYISQCQQKGFHPHPNEPPIYEESLHVKLDEFATITVVDLRK